MLGFLLVQNMDNLSGLRFSPCSVHSPGYNNMEMLQLLPLSWTNMLILFLYISLFMCILTAY